MVSHPTIYTWAMAPQVFTECPKRVTFLLASVGSSILGDAGAKALVPPHPTHPTPGASKANLTSAAILA